MMWGLIGTVLIGLVRTSVDFTAREPFVTKCKTPSTARRWWRNEPELDLDQRTARRGVLRRRNGRRGIGPRYHLRRHRTRRRRHRVDARMPMQLSLGRIVSNEPWDIEARAIAEANASPPIEVALVLDNPARWPRHGRVAQRRPGFGEALLSLDGDTVSVALVPFVAQVNIGNQASRMAWMDTAGAAATMANCWKTVSRLSLD